jgi:cysteine desulfurase/selenocysteine lyase
MRSPMPILSEYANVHRGLHYLSNTATDNYEAAREKVRRFPERAVGGRNRVHPVNDGSDQPRVLWPWTGDYFGEGDEIVISIMEHHSNIVPWHFHRERNGAVLKWVYVREDGSFDLDAFADTLSDRTKLVAITHLSNVLGTVVPVKEVCRIAHERGIPVLVDGSQAAVHLPVDVQDIDCDYYVFTGHKVYGPTGIGVLWAKSDRLKAMRPFCGGGEMILDVTEDVVTYADPPHRFEAGTPPIVQAIGLGAALDYMDSIGRENIARHEADLWTMPTKSCRRSIRSGSSAMRRARARSSLSKSKAPMPTMWRRLSTAPAWRCEPGPIAPSRSWQNTA